MRYINALLFLFMTLGCGEKDFDIVNLNNNQVTILGHGGMGIEHLYPLNSFESIQHCLQLGADGTELDIQMTEDSVLVVFHNERLESATHLSGQIFDKTWAEIKDAQYLYPPYAGYKIIRLDRLFFNISNPEQYTFFLECKPYRPAASAAYVDSFARALISIIDQYRLERDRIFIESGKTDLIASLKEKKPDLNMFVYADITTALSIIEEFDLQGISIAIDEISEEEVAMFHEREIMVSVFNTHSRKRNIDAIEKNVDFIQTDKLKHLIKMLE